MQRISNDDLPALFRACDRASVSAQKQYAGLTAASLSFLISAAGLAALTLNDALDKGVLAIVSAIILTFSVAFIVVIRLSKLEQTWYDGRAIAESVKTLAWRYMTRTEPYGNNQPDKVDELFINDLKSIFFQRKAFAARLGGQSAIGQCITHKMRQMRNLAVEDKRKLYISERISAQRKWYCDKAEYNRKSVNRMFVAIVALYILAILSAFAMVRWPECPLNPSGIFITMAMAFLAWTQMKRHQELAQSYAVAAQELGFIEEGASLSMRDEELSLFVVNSENAISREHTLWRARRCVE